MNKIENNLISSIKDVIKELYNVEDSSLVMIEIPKDNTNGDYSTNIAMRLAKVVRKAPVIIAKEMLEKLEETVEDYEKIEVAGPGFINFFMKNTVLADIINVVLDKKETYGENNSGDNLPILIGMLVLILLVIYI